MNGRLHIYLAWPPDQLEAVLTGAGRLIQAGHVPIMQSSSGKWTDLDRHRVAACACLIRWPGDSVKCDFAVDYAKVLGLPVYFSLKDCLNALPKRVEA